MPPTHPAFWNEFADAIRYFAKAAGAGIALDFESCIHRNLAGIQAHPLHHHERRKSEIRRVNLGPQFREWYIAYMLWKDGLVILALAHAKRPPNYFRSRIPEAKMLL